jgi:hypothetical protein
VVDVGGSLGTARKPTGKWLMYRVVVAYKVGVICRSCGRRIEIEDEYIRGVRAVEMAAVFYKPVAEKFADFASVAWQQTLSCGNPGCGKTHEYRGDDLLLYDG